VTNTDPFADSDEENPDELTRMDYCKRGAPCDGFIFRLGIDRRLHVIKRLRGSHPRSQDAVFPPQRPSERQAHPSAIHDPAETRSGRFQAADGWD
jgi:hypothetical protein